MALTIEMPPEAEARLRAKARHQGQAAEEYVRSLVERDLGGVAEPVQPNEAQSAQANREEIERRLQALRELDVLIKERGDPRAEAGLPPLSDYDVSRAGIYEEESGGRG